MRQHESRIPLLIPTNIIVKRVQDMPTEKLLQLVMPSNLIKEHCTKYARDDIIGNGFIEWYNNQHPNQPYKDNPYVFIIKREKINKIDLDILILYSKKNKTYKYKNGITLKEIK